MDKIKVREIAETITKVLNSSEEMKKFNVNFKYNRGRFTDVEFNMKISCSEKVSSSGAPVEDKMVRDWKTYAHMFGIDPANLNKHIFVGGNEYQIVGMKPSYRKYPVIVKKLGSNRQFKFSIEWCNRALGQSGTLKLTAFDRHIMESPETD